MAHESEGMPFIWRAVLAGIMATVVTFGVWAATDLIFGGACIVGAICGVVAYIFTGMGGPEPVLKYQGDGVSVPGTRGLAPDAVSGSAPAPEAAPVAETAADPVPTEQPAPASEPEPAPASSDDTSETVGSSDVVKPSTKLAASEELAARKGDWTYDGAGEPEASADAASDTKDADADEDADAKDEAAETAPELYTDAAPSDPDDLKKIKGVGPGLEKTLNEMGIYKFAQIATWGPGEIAWVDARLKFKGRITRDDWIGQAKEFSGQS